MSNDPVVTDKSTVPDTVATPPIDSTTTTPAALPSDIVEPDTATEPPKDVPDISKSDDTPPTDTPSGDKLLSLKDFIKEASGEEGDSPHPQPQQSQQTKPSTTSPSSRDLSDIDEVDRPYFRAMSNEAFERMKSLYKEHKKTREELSEYKKQLAQVPSSFYEHPDSYVLDPRYQQNQQILNQVTAELQHWEEQYEKIARGEDWEDLVVENGKIVKVSRQADARSSVNVMSYITEARRLLGQSYENLEKIRRTHQDNFKAIKNTLDRADKEFFPQYPNYDELVKVNPAAKLMHQALDDLGFSHNPLKTLMVKLYTSYVDLRKQLGTKAPNQNVGTIERPKNPTSREMSGGAKTTGNDKVSLDDFMKAIES